MIMVELNENAVISAGPGFGKDEQEEEEDDEEGHQREEEGRRPIAYPRLGGQCRVHHPR